jgi:hypothetical protein
VTLTAHRHAAVVCTITCWPPAVVSGLTDWPEAAVDVTAGVEPAAAPELTTKIWKDGPPVGAGVHWKAHPMFHVPPAMVNTGLVQFPLWVVWGTSTVAGPTAAGEVGVVDAPAAVVAVVDVLPAAVVAVEPAPDAAADGGAVVALAPLGGNL